MHRSREKVKIYEGDGGQFPGNRALEFSEIAWVCYHHPYASPHEAIFQMDGQILRKCKNG